MTSPDSDDALMAEPEQVMERSDESERLDEDNRLKPEFVRRVREALAQGDTDRVYDLVEPLHPADIADLFELADENERLPLAKAIRDQMSVEVIAELNDYVREVLVGELPAELVADIAGQLETDDAVAMIEDLDQEDQDAILAELEPEDRAAIVAALGYPEESAGRMMSRDFVAVPEHMTVGDLIDFLREGGDLPTDFWEVFIVTPGHKPVGTCALSWIMRTPRHICLADVMSRDQTLIPVDMDQEEVALRFQKYALISAAVTGRDGRLEGVITADDVVHIVAEEAGEDILRLSGAGDGDIFEPVADTYRARIRWLVANLLTALVSASIIASFGDTIEKMVVLAALSPIVASIGGNTGNQTMAVIVRAIATGQMTSANTRRTIFREALIALFNGLTIAVLLGSGVLLIFQDSLLAAVIAAAILFNLLVAGFAGVFVPLGLKRVGVDPAVASSVFVTMITDSMGFLLFLGLATVSGLVG